MTVRLFFDYFELKEYCRRNNIIVVTERIVNNRKEKRYEHCHILPLPCIHR